MDHASRKCTVTEHVDEHVNMEELTKELPALVPTFSMDTPAPASEVPPPPQPHPSPRPPFAPKASQSAGQGAAAPTSAPSGKGSGAAAPDPVEGTAADGQDEEDQENGPLGIWDCKDEGERRTTADGKVVTVTGTKNMQEKITLPVFPKSGQHQ